MSGFTNTHEGTDKVEHVLPSLLSSQRHDASSPTQKAKLKGEQFDRFRHSTLHQPLRSHSLWESAASDYVYYVDPVGHRRGNWVNSCTGSHTPRPYSFGLPDGTILRYKLYTNHGSRDRVLTPPPHSRKKQETKGQRRVRLAKKLGAAEHSQLLRSQSLVSL